LQQFKESEFSVVRQHEEFIWLHDRYNENPEYAGIIVSIPFYHVLNEIYYQELNVLTIQNAQSSTGIFHPVTLNKQL